MQAVYADTLRWRDSGAPFGVAGIPFPEASRATDNRVAVESDQTLSDMALATVRALLDSSPNVDASTPDQIIVCTTSFEHDLALSCACRLHSELGSSRAPLAVGQLQGVSFLMALDIAVAMMAADIRLNTVAIVAAERWRRPFSRRIGALIDMSDGAAAVLIAKHPGPGWCVSGLTIRTPGIPPLASEREPAYLSTLTDVISETCAIAGVQPDKVDWVLPAQSILDWFTKPIHVADCGPNGSATYVWTRPVISAPPTRLHGSTRCCGRSTLARDNMPSFGPPAFKGRPVALSLNFAEVDHDCVAR